LVCQAKKKHVLRQQHSQQLVEASIVDERTPSIEEGQCGLGSASLFVLCIVLGDLINKSSLLMKERAIV
jgi:hypothetical protein